MRLSYLLYFVLSFLPCVANANMDDILPKTPVKIVDMSIGMPSTMNINIMGATAESQVVVLLKLSKYPGLWVASDERGPSLPIRNKDLPDSGGPNAISSWYVEYQVPEEYGVILDAYAIVCSVKSRKDWPRSRDYKGFVYLPFNHMKDIDEALLLLSDFGWIPTGLTTIALKK